MKIDHEKMKQIAKMSDEKLWETVVGMAKGAGISLNSISPRKEDVEKLRSLLSRTEELGTWDAVKVINEYRRKYGKG